MFVLCANYLRFVSSEDHAGDDVEARVAAALRALCGVKAHICSMSKQVSNAMLLFLLLSTSDLP